jgi:hypothetical protein
MQPARERFVVEQPQRIDDVRRLKTPLVPWTPRSAPAAPRAQRMPHAGCAAARATARARRARSREYHPSWWPRDGTTAVAGAHANRAGPEAAGSRGDSSTPCSGAMPDRATRACTGPEPSTSRCSSTISGPSPPSGTPGQSRGLRRLLSRMRSRGSWGAARWATGGVSSSDWPPAVPHVGMTPASLCVCGTTRTSPGRRGRSGYPDRARRSVRQRRL